MLIVTSIITAVLTIIFVKLSFAVIGLRRKNQVGLGSGGHEGLERAIRAQGNFAEYVPFGLFLIAALELNGAPSALVAFLGLILVVGRFLHAKGINEPPPNFTNRVRGMKLTFAALGLSAVANLAWVGYLVISST